MATKVQAPSAAPAASIGITVEQLDAMRTAFDADPSNRLMLNAVTQSDVDEVALDRSLVTGAVHTYTHVLDTWTATEQKRSGRCWIFAALNLFRGETVKALDLDSFEFSQSHLMFWDKVERSNFFLETMIELADRPVDDRAVAWMLGQPIPDAGQWDMLAPLIRKYGVVPKEVFPETESSGNTAKMNAAISYHLRNAAARIRKEYASKGDAESMRKIKRRALETVYKILCIHLGNPPAEFLWQWKDQKGTFHRDGRMTPVEFARKYVSTPYEDFVCLVHDPRESSPLGRTYTIAHLGNVVGESDVRYLNIDVGLMKQIVMEQIVAGSTVWFGCDTGKQAHKDLGIWDADLYDYEAVYDVPFSMTKAERLDYHQSRMTHAMLFTGVDIVDGRPRRWRVENSAGESPGDRGFWLMNDSWFDEYVSEIAVHRDCVPADLRPALDTDPIVLPPWDPMGALAR